MIPRYPIDAWLTQPQREPKLEPLPEDRDMSAFEKACAAVAVVLLAGLSVGVIWAVLITGAGLW